MIQFTEKFNSEKVFSPTDEEKKLNAEKLKKLYGKESVLFNPNDELNQVAFEESKTQLLDLLDYYLLKQPTLTIFQVFKNAIENLKLGESKINLNSVFNKSKVILESIFLLIEEKEIYDPVFFNSFEVSKCFPGAVLNWQRVKNALAGDDFTSVILLQREKIDTLIIEFLKESQVEIRPEFEVHNAEALRTFILDTPCDDEYAPTVKSFDPTLLINLKKYIKKHFTVSTLIDALLESKSIPKLPETTAILKNSASENELALYKEHEMKINNFFSWCGFKEPQSFKLYKELDPDNDDTEDYIREPKNLKLFTRYVLAEAIQERSYIKNLFHKFDDYSLISDDLKTVNYVEGEGYYELKNEDVLKLLDHAEIINEKGEPIHLDLVQALFKEFDLDTLLNLFLKKEMLRCKHQEKYSFDLLLSQPYLPDSTICLISEKLLKDNHEELKLDFLNYVFTNASRRIPSVIKLLINSLSPSNRKVLTQYFTKAVYLDLIHVVDFFLGDRTLIFMIDDKGSLLHRAATSNSLEVMALLMEKYNFSPNASCIKEGFTPIQLAAEYGHPKAIELLCAKGGDPHIACYPEQDDMVLTAADRAASEGYISALIELKKQGVNLSELNRVGVNPLSVAVVFGQTKVIKWLQQNYANYTDLTKQRFSGCSLVHLAVQNGQLETLKFLASQKAPGFDFNEKNQEGETPLLIAAIADSIEIVQYLFEEQKITLDDQQLNDGSTLLHIAASNGAIDLMEYFLKHFNHFDINVQKADGSTPALIAAKKGDPRMFKFLLDLKADLSIPDNNAMTSFQYAAQHNDVYMMGLILEYDANLISEKVLNEIINESLHKANAPLLLSLLELRDKKGLKLELPEQECLNAIVQAVQTNNSDMLNALQRYDFQLVTKFSLEKAEELIKWALSSDCVDIVEWLIKSDSQLNFHKIKVNNEPFTDSILLGCRSDLLNTMLLKGYVFKFENPDDISHEDKVGLIGESPIDLFKIKSMDEVVSDDHPFGEVQQVVVQSNDYIEETENFLTVTFSKDVWIEAVKNAIESDKAYFLQFMFELDHYTLIDFKIDDGIQNFSNLTHLAAEKVKEGRHEVIQWMLENSFDFTSKNLEGKTPADILLYRGNLELLSDVLQTKEPNLLSETHCTTPLKQAIVDKNMRPLELIYNFYPQVLKNLGNAIELAAEKNNLEALLFLEQIQEPYDANDIFNIALYHGSTAVVLYLNSDQRYLILSDDERLKMTLAAIKNNDLPLFNVIEALDKDLIQIEFIGLSHEIAKHGSLEMIEYFFEEFQTNVNSQNVNSYIQNLIETAIQYRNIPFINYIENKNLTYSIEQEKIFKAFEKATQNSDIEMMNVLYEMNSKHFKTLPLLNYRQPEDKASWVHFALTSEIVTWFAQRGLSLNLPTSKGVTPMIQAVSRHLFEVMDSLYLNGVDLDKQLGPERRNLLHIIALNDSVDLFKYLMPRMANFDTLLNARTQDEFTPLMIAIKEGSTEVIKVLLNEEAVQHYIKQNGTDETLIAIFSEDLTTLKKLYEIDPDIINRTLNNDEHFLYNFLEEEFNTEEEFNHSAQILHWLFEVSGENLVLKKILNSLCLNGYSPVHLCLINNKLTELEILVANGANVNLPTHDGETTAHLAIRKADIRLLASLIKAGVKLFNINEKGEDFFTALTSLNQQAVIDQLKNNKGFVRENFTLNAALRQDLPALMLLAENGFPFRPNYKGLSVVHVLAQAGLHKEIIKLKQIREDLDLNVISEIYDTPIACAFSEGQMDTVIALVLHGVDLKNVNVKGEDIFTFIKNQDYSEIKPIQNKPEESGIENGLGQFNEENAAANSSFKAAVNVNGSHPENEGEDNDIHQVHGVLENMNLGSADPSFSVHKEEKEQANDNSGSELMFAENGAKKSDQIFCSQISEVKIGVDDFMWQMKQNAITIALNAAFRGDIATIILLWKNEFDLNEKNHQGINLWDGLKQAGLDQMIDLLKEEYSKVVEISYLDFECKPAGLSSQDNQNNKNPQENQKVINQFAFFLPQGLNASEGKSLAENNFQVSGIDVQPFSNKEESFSNNDQSFQDDEEPLKNNSFTSF